MDNTRSISEVSEKAVSAVRHKTTRYSLISVLRPFLIVAKCFGIFPAKNIITRRHREVTFSWFSIEHLWSVIFFLWHCNVGVWASFLQVFPGEFNPQSFVDTIVYALGVNAMFSLYTITAFIAIYLNTTSLVNLLHDLQKLGDKFTYNFGQYMKSPLFQLSRKLKITIVIIFTTDISLQIVQIISMFILEQRGNNVISVFGLFAQMIMWIQDFVATCLILSISDSLKTIFSLLNTIIQRSVSQHLTQSTEEELKDNKSLKTVRELHMDCCELVNSFSSCFGAYIFIVFVGQIVSFIAGTYIGLTTLSVKSITAGHVITPLYTLLFVVRFGLITSTLAAVGRASKECYTDMCRLDLDVIPEKERSQFKQLLHQMSGCPVDISACGFFKVNRKILPPIGNAVATYLVVLLQFKAEESSGNCTGETKTSSTSSYSSIMP